MSCKHKLLYFVHIRSSIQLKYSFLLSGFYSFSKHTYVHEMPLHTSSGSEKMPALHLFTRRLHFHSCMLARVYKPHLTDTLVNSQVKLPSQ